MISLPRRFSIPKLFRSLALILMTTTLASQSAQAQKILRGFDLPDKKKSIAVPFDFENGFIIVELILQDAFPLKFLVDTGAEYTILAEKSIGDLLHFNYERSFNILGSDLQAELVAHLARNVKLNLGHMEAKYEDILVLDQNIFEFETFAGVTIHGILGANSFRNLILQIDYQKEELIFHRNKTFNRNKKSFTTIPIDVKKNKPFLTANFASTLGINSQSVKLLLDTGANIPFLIRRDSNSMANHSSEHLLPGNIASGLGGDLVGYVGRSHNLKFNDFEFTGVITNYQVVSTEKELEYKELLGDRNGIIGNPILSRFDLILDLVNEELHLRPNRNYKRKFKYDRSGLQLIAGGKNLKAFTIYGLLPNSPAAQSGLKIGDEVLAINGLSSKLFTLASATGKFQHKEGKLMKLKIDRGGRIMYKKFRLKELI